LVIGQVVKQYAAGRGRRWRVTGVERRVAHGTAAAARQLLRATQGAGVLNTAYIERLNATFRQHLASLGRRTPAMAAGVTDQCWSIAELLEYRVPLPRWQPPKKRGRRSKELQELIKRWAT
jgi:hypothetical protein